MAPWESSKVMEDKLYDLLGTTKTFDEIAEELGIGGDELAPKMTRVIAERGDPNLDAAREARERLARIRF